MATGLKGYPATLGGKVVKIAYASGPASYANGVGLPVVDRAFRSLDYVNGSLTVSGTYQVEAQPVTIGNGVQWNLRWFVISTGLEVAGGTNLSGETVQYLIIGG